MSAMAAYAGRYCEIGLALTALLGKAPITSAWNCDENLIRDPLTARAYWRRNPSHNIGACLEPSRLVSLDADYLDGTRIVLTAENIDIDALIAVTPTIIGRAPRLMFAAPEGTPLSRKALVWAPRTAVEKPVTVLELRAGRVQDVLPPSIHPDTLRPYRWLTPPTHGFPPLPGDLLQLWLDFDRFKHRALALCPWAAPENGRTPTRSRTAPYSGPSDIRAFNESHDVVSILETHGYQRTGARRWKSPAGHGMAGLVLLPDGKVFCHHVSDPLGDDKPHDAFDLYSLFDHGGDFRKAVRAAAQMLGLRQGTAS